MIEYTATFRITFPGKTGGIRFTVDHIRSLNLTESDVECLRMRDNTILPPVIQHLNPGDTVTIRCTKKGKSND